MRKNSPCFGCDDRNETYHGKCDAYKTWSAENTAERERRNAANKEYYDHIGEIEATKKRIKNAYKRAGERKRKGW